MNNIHPFLDEPRLSSTLRRAVVLLFTLAWAALASAGEIHDAAKNGDLNKVRSLLTANPDLVFSKGSQGTTPLHWAAAQGHKDVVKLLLASKAEVMAKAARASSLKANPIVLLPAELEAILHRALEEGNRSAAAS